jgi:DNA-binding winged helix-turn-helix (wHTH) protein/TolB-like protein
VLERRKTLASGDSPAQQLVEFAGFRLDSKRRQLTTVDGEPVALNSRGFDTLLALIARRGETLSKQELLETVWPNVVVEENNLNQAISALRKALGDSQDRHRIIMTIPGRGYCFIADLKVVQEEIPEPEVQVPTVLVNAGAGQASSLVGNLKIWTVLATVTSIVLLVLLLMPWQRAVEGVSPATTSLRFEPVSSSLPTSTSVTPGILPSSIAVFPFTTAGSDPENDYFGLGLYDEVLIQLSQLSTVNVIAGNTMQQYNNSGKSRAEIARELRVGSVLEGQVLSKGNNLRVSLQLTDPHTDLLLWSASYDADMDNMNEIFAIEADIITSAARAIGADLLPVQVKQVALVLTHSPEAYQSYMKAHAALAMNDYWSALGRLEDAVVMDPGFITGWSKVSLINTLLAGIPRGGSDQQFNRALEAADRAVEINPDYALAHIARAAALHNAGDWGGAADEYRKARELGAALEGSSLFSLFQMSLGDFTGAKHTLERNLRTDPVNLISRGFLMLAHEYLGESTYARAEYSKGEALYPNWWGDSTGIWLALGRKDTDYLAKSIVEFPNFALREVLEVYASPADAVAELVRVQLRPENYNSGQLNNAAMFAAYYGEHAMALEFLRGGLSNNGLSLYLVWLPVFDELRKTEEFKQFLLETGLPDYWRVKGWPEVCSPKGANDFVCEWTAYQ